MEHNIAKGFILNRQAAVICINSRDIVDAAIKSHRLSPVCAAALGRALTVTALLAAGMKNLGDSITATVKGGGPCGAVVTACDGALRYLRGYVDNPHVELPLKADGKLDVGGVVGAAGTLTVIKDLGLKRPYVGKTNLVSGEIAEDFAYYLAVSEQQPAIVSLGVLVDRDYGCKSAGGIIVSLMPGCSAHTVQRTEELADSLSGISTAIEGLTAEQYLKTALSAHGIEVLQKKNAVYRCKCSQASTERAVLALGKQDAYRLIEERGSISIVCHFCSSEYIYGAEDIKRLFG